MASIIIDSCSWAQLSKPKFAHILTKLNKLVEEHLVEILVNDILIDEWDRNKERYFQEIISTIKEWSIAAIKIKPFLPEKEAIQLDNILSKYISHEESKIQLATEHFNKVENLLKLSTYIRITDELKFKMVEKAVAGEAPFHNSKNNMADALIIFSAIDWVNKNKLIQQDLLFVSHNYKEFAKGKENLDTRLAAKVI